MADRPAVAHTLDFERVAAIPRRTLSQGVADMWAEVLTVQLRRPDAACTLRPWQAYVLYEAATVGGCWAALPVGVGKTLICYCLPALLQAEKPLLIISGSLEDKTWADFAALEAQGWLPGPAPYRIVTWQWLAREENAEFLAEYAPDLVCIDESDDLANRHSAASRRLDRYRLVSQNATFVALTGTPSRNSVMAYWHLLCWCLLDGAPMPMRESEALMWAAALDEKVREPNNRPHPGPLGATRLNALEWFSRRLIETPGVVIVDGDSCDQPLVIHARLSREDPVLNEAFQRFLEEQENPGGIAVSDPLSRWLLDAQLGLGLYTRWNPPPPDDWRNTRREIARFVREAIANSTRGHRPLDTEGQVLRRYREHPLVRHWLAIKDTFDAVTEAIWISTSTLQACLDWLGESPEPGIVWCGSVDFARALAKLANLPYYGAQGRTDDGEKLHKAPVRNIVASWQANKKGFNLQAWPRQLVTMPPQSAKWLEQIFGRSHRSGQDRPVRVELLMTSGGSIDAFKAAIAEAQFARGTVTLTQKILRAIITYAKPNITESNQFRWATRSRGR